MPTSAVSAHIAAISQKEAATAINQRQPNNLRQA